jgi:tRNA G26 N,N-dimethylase Trm1
LTGQRAVRSDTEAIAEESETILNDNNDNSIVALADNVLPVVSGSLAADITDSVKDMP